ncbi:MAG: hypothetical protein GWN00_36405, partial [Aliifodinibius sp.]|nr:hypothetical protein [Fodinibius sp.]NIV16099.1 hypothetical protein [Fodinibius sp.]NIY30073.1 hypothetical protein [Fodinibius sp.]
MNKKITIVIGILLAILILAVEASAQSGFIYGKVTTIDGDIYRGQIRWGG